MVINSNALRISAALVFLLFVMLLYDLVLPSFFEHENDCDSSILSESSDRPIISNTLDKACSDRDIIEPAKGVRSEKGDDERAGHVNVMEALEEQLDPSLLFPLLMINLTNPKNVEAAVKRWARQLADELKNKGISPSDLLEIYHQCSSNRMRQAIMLTWYLMDPEDGESFLSAGLTDPEMIAVASFALGSLGSEKAVQLLTDAILCSDRSPKEREILASGLAKAGADAVPILLKVVTQLLLEGESLDPSSFLGAIKDPKARDSLKGIIDNYFDPQVRTMALRGLISSCREDETILSWAMELLSDESEDLQLRLNGFMFLCELTPKHSQAMISKLFLSPTTPPEMYAAILDFFAGAGVPGEYVDWVSNQLEEEVDSNTRQQALGALASSQDPRARKVLADLYSKLDENERVKILSTLRMCLSNHQDDRIPKELLTQIAQTLESPHIGENEKDFAFGLLASLEEYREEALHYVYNNLLRPVADPEVRFRNLFRSIRILGRDAISPLEQTFQSAENLIQRFEIATLMASYPEIAGDQAAIRFTRQETLPFIREYLLSDPDSILAYTDQKYKAPIYVQSMVNILGRYGNRADIEQFESFVKAVEERTQSWPEHARLFAKDIMDDSAERIRDLVLFRQGGGRDEYQIESCD